MIRNFKELAARAKSGPRRTVVVAGVENDAVIQAVRQAWEEGFIKPLLVDTEPKLSGITTEFSKDVDTIPAHSGGETSIANRAVALINSGRGEILLKGSIPTAVL
ncbi:MAG: hypothetical protein P8Y60_14710, partial [Calditrichota bacterium]